MIIWDLNPVAFSLGPVQIRWYGIVYALGFLLGHYVLRKAAREKLIPNLTEKLAEDFILLLMMGSIIVSRLTEVLVYNPVYYFHNPLEIPAVWHGGLSIHGGLIGAVLVTIYFCKKYKINFYKIADILVVPLALVLVFGRLTNYVNGELWGRKTDVSWCVVFPGAEGCRHPSQLYEALYSYVLFVILLVMQEMKRFADGVIFWSFVFFYGLFRFVVTFYREFDPGDPGILGISIGQWLSLLMIAAALCWFWLMKRSGHPLTLKKRTHG
jgi:phosphatidylglycerol---prolipoprotein diacylglyceryl transferase